MDEERSQKVEKGLERLAVYKKKKEKVRGTMSERSSNSDSSLSLSPVLLPENRDTDQDQISGASSISEHISSGSAENDRSFQEIEISNVPENLSLILKQSDDIVNISQENRPSFTPSLKSDDTAFNSSASKNAQSILEEILRNEQFKSEKSDSCRSTDASLDIFAGINLDDNSINHYVSRMKSQEDGKEDSEATIRNLEELLNAKENVIAALNLELDEVKDVASNQSTLSLTTTLTEYKQCQEECTNKIVDYKNALTHRDGLIDELTLSLQKSLENEAELRSECEQFAKEIQVLQTELAEAADYIKKHKCSEESEAQSADVAEICSKLEEKLTPAQIMVLDEFKISINEYIQRQISENKATCQNEIKILKDKLENEKSEYSSEISRLRELLASVRCESGEIIEVRKELRAKYMVDMEELRKYYEKKCADMEKQYSDDIFSQQSRKMSSSSICSEPEFASDLIFASNAPVPGPGGDPGTPLRSKEHLKSLSKSDLVHFKKHLVNFSSLLNKYDVENLNSNELDELKTNLQSLDVKALLKLDLNTLKHDLQSKYNAELEILREDYENQIDLMQIQHENNLKEMENRCEGFKEQLEEAKRGEAAVQETIFASDPCDDSNWPEEYVQIREKFTEKYEKDIAELKENHEEEISRLKKEHLKTLNGALERARRRSLKEGDSYGDLEIVKERNNLKKSTGVLRNLIGELLKYFTKCEDELNNTLVEELIKQGTFDPDSEMESSQTDVSFSTRVHLTPNIQAFLNLVETSSLESKDVSDDLKSELGSCLDRLKADANAVLALTTNFKEKQDAESTGDKMKSLEDRINSLTRQLITDSQIKEDLSTQLTDAREFVRNLELERVNLERRNEQIVAKNHILDEQLAKARDKIGELIECGRKEIVSEGYGENDKMGLHGGTVSRATLCELQEKARLIAAQKATKADDPLLQLVEELCREGDRLVDEAKREREDYLQQIESADKKLRATTHFLEEQAVEREQERDEAQKDIAKLKEQLRERDKDRAGFERIRGESEDLSTMMNVCCKRVHGEILSTVEQLVEQMRDMSKLIDESEQKNAALEKERAEAVDKIFVLRDIIRNLETQVDVKSRAEAELKEIVDKLEDVIKHHREANEELTAQLESGANATAYREHLNKLEAELQKLRLTNELAGNEGVVKHIQLQLHEIEVTIDKATQELEGLHGTISGTTCSSPSEEMSIRDQIRPQTPNTSTEVECEIPLQQLARLKEKLIKHSRAEHAAMKRIQDLEMQLVSAKHEHDDLQNEKDVLQEQVSEQLVLISSLQIRLDDQRIRAEHIQKQTNASLEVRIYDLENEMQTLRDTLRNKDGTIKQLNKVVEQTKQLLTDRERELSSAVEEKAFLDLQSQIEQLKDENDVLRTKIASDAQNAQLLPGLVDNILTDKNRDIETLRLKLGEAERQMELYLSLNLEKDRLQKSDERGLLSFVDHSGPDQLRKAGYDRSLEVSDRSNLAKANFDTDISSIDRIGSPHLHYTVDAPLVKPNSTEIVEKRVHFQDEIKELQDKIAEDATKITSLEDSLHKEQEETKRLHSQLTEASNKLTEQQKSIDLLTEDMKRKDGMYFTLAQEKHELEKQFSELNKIEMMCRELQDKESDLQKLVDEKNMEIEDKNRLNSKLENEVENKRKHLKSLAEDTSQIKTLFEENTKKLQAQLDDKNTQLETNKAQIARYKHLLEDRECELEILNEDITRYQNEIAGLEERVKQRDIEDEQLKMMKQRKEVAEKDLEIVKLKTTIGDLKKEIIHLQDLVSEKEKIIAHMQVDSESLRVSLEAIKDKVNESGNLADLRVRLKYEQKINAQLRAELEGHNEMATSIDEITEQVRKQLDDSVHLDDTIIRALNESDYAFVTDVEVLRAAITKESILNIELKHLNDDFEVKVKQLEEKLLQSIDAIKQLEHALDSERRQCNQIKVEDSNLLEQMRLKLESALENENEFENVIKEEKKRRMALEAEIVALRQKKDASSASSKTEYKSLPDLEVVRMTNELKTLNEENVRLRKEIKNSKLLRHETEASLKYTKDMLNLKAKELNETEKQLKDTQEEMVMVKQMYMATKAELDQKHREIENSRQLIDELEQEKQALNREVNNLSITVRSLEEDRELHEEAAADREAQLSSTLPDKLMQKLKDIGDVVNEHLKQSNTIDRLTDENNKLQNRIRDIEDLHQMKSPFDDPEARANYLFGKYLRADSYRKSLAWQKKYLINLLATYQDYTPLNEKFKTVRKKEKTAPISRFRSAVVVIIAIQRMKFMVQRWHSGTRGGAYTHQRRSHQRPQVQEKSSPATHFKVGQPVSSQHFSNHSIPNRRDYIGTSALSPDPRPKTPPVTEEAAPWSGFTPPSKERRSFNVSAIPETVPNIEKCIEKFNLIHQRLGMTLNSQNT